MSADPEFPGLKVYPDQLEILKRSPHGLEIILDLVHDIEILKAQVRLDKARRITANDRERTERNNREENEARRRRALGF